MNATATPNYSIISLPWERETALRYFTPIAHQPWAMLLHSGFARHPHNRFDIVTASPRVTLQTWGDKTQICEDNTSHEAYDDPLFLLQQVLEKQNWRTEPRDDLPFTGGALGLFGYDLGRRFEKIPTIADRDVNAPDMAVGIYDWALVVDHHLERVSLVCHGDADARLAWLEAQSKPQVPAFRLTSAWQANMSRAGYGEKFRQIQAWLANGDCYQVNLARRFCADYEGDEWQAFLALNTQNCAPFSAFLRLPEHAILSLSPERFIRLAQGEIETRPIKGTLPRLACPQADALQAQKLAQSTKDRAENLMIVDLLRNDIGRVAEPGSVRVPELFVVEQFPAVHHLVSTVCASLPPSLHATDLLRACFPGGSITGAPKVRAMEIIETLEPQRRNAWCGSIGYLSSCGTMDTSITIRTVIAQAGQLFCAAGGGIVFDSEEEAEYQETITKINAILACLEK